MCWNEIGRQLLEGNSWKEFGVKKVRHAEENQSDSKNIAPNRDKPMRPFRPPLLCMHCGKRQSTPAEGKLPYAQRPDKPAVREGHHSGDIHQCFKTEKHDSEKSGRQPGVFLEHDAQAPQNETRSYEIDPEGMGWNPGRYDLAYGFGKEVVVQSEHNHGHGDEHRTTKDDLIQPVRQRRGLLNRYSYADNQQQNRGDVG